MEAIKTEEYKGYTIEIYYDDMAESPRKWDNLGTMICFHKKYTLGNKHDVNFNDFNSWEDMEKHLRKKYIAVIPMYMYDHSGITVNTTGFSCPWDSGQIGFIVCSREKICKEFNVSRVKQSKLKDVERILEGEVKTYDDYLTCQVYGYKIFKGDEELDSCWGFFGDYDAEYGALSEAKSIIDNYTKGGKDHTGQFLIEDYVKKLHTTESLI